MPMLPKDLGTIRNAALGAIAPIRPADEASKADKDFLLKAKRTKASHDLPPYYLIYFLLVDLLGFENLGRSEKVAWSVPIDFNGCAFLIEHRKFGVGVFAHDPTSEEYQAQQIVSLIKRGTRAAEPYYDWLANCAMQQSTLNVVNKSDMLFCRFRYFLSAHTKAAQEAEKRADECHVTRREVRNSTVTHFEMPAFELRGNARWLAVAAVDAFFSWTEHVFIHLAILRGTVKTGLEVADLADTDWQSKFKRALDIKNSTTKALFDELVELRRQIRNFMAHGAFGKQGEAFSFHSGAGAVPLLLPHKRGKRRFAINDDLAIEDARALQLIDEFIQHLWSGDREPAYYYIQKGGLPLILTYAQDGTYANAMRSVVSMKEFVDYLCAKWDMSANMDW